MSRFDIATDELVVFPTAPPGVAIAQIERIGQQLLIVGADIQRHREAAARIDAAAGGVEGQFAHSDLDATHTPVTDTQDRLGIGAHDQVDVLGPQPQRVEGFLDFVGFVDAQKQSALPAVFVGEALDCLANGGRVHHRHQFGQMVGQHLEVQHLVAVVQLFEKQVAAQIGGQALQLMPYAFGLLVEREHGRRKPAGQPQPPPLRVGEADSTVETWCGQRGRDPWHAGVAHHNLRS